MGYFTDKVVVITGASSGIGRATALEFAKNGAKVVIASRSKERLSKVQTNINNNQGVCLAIMADVTAESDCRRVINETIATFGAIDILVNNAGLSMRALFDDVQLGVLRQVMEVNFWGTVYCTKFALPYIQQSKGSIVGISSIASFHGLPGRTAYSASKSAMQGFLESVRIENMKKGVKVLLISAGFTASNIRLSALGPNGEPQNQSPLHEDRLTPPERVAREILKSIRKRKRNRIMSLEGQLMVLFQRIIPRVIDRVIYNKFRKEPNSPLA